MNAGMVLGSAMLGMLLALGCGGSAGFPDADAGDSGSSSSGSGSSSGSSGAGGNDASGGGGDVDAGSGPTSTGVVCNAAGTCTPPMFCCPGGRGGDICATARNCRGDTYLCTGQANCPSNQVCCVTQQAPGVADMAQCQTSCPPGGGSQATGGERFIVCQSSAECPAGMQCTPPMNGLTIATICQ